MLTERRFALLQLMVLIPVALAVVVLMLSQASIRRTYELGRLEWGPLIQSADRVEQTIDELDTVARTDDVRDSSIRIFTLERETRFALGTMERELTGLRDPKLMRLFRLFRDAVLRVIEAQRELAESRRAGDTLHLAELRARLERQVANVHARRTALAQEAINEAGIEADGAAGGALSIGRILLDITIAFGLAALLFGTIWLRGTRRRIKEVNHRLAQLAEGQGAHEAGDDIEVVERTIDQLQAVLREKQALSEKLSRIAVEWTESFDAVGSPMVVLDTQRRVSRLNNAAARLAGLSYDQAIGRRLSEIGSDEPWRTADGLGHDLESGTSAHKVARSAGRLWEIYVHVGSDRRTLIFLDRTKIDKLQDDLRRSEMMATLGTLVGGVAHEVRNPLFGLSAVIDALEGEEDPTAVLPEYLKSLREDLDRLKRLMNDLLEFGKPRSAGTTLVNVPQIIQYAIRELRTEAERRDVGIRVLNKAQGAASVSGTESDLSVAFRNVLDNAIRHSPAGAEIEISIENFDGSIEVTVVDAGRGFDPTDLQKVFQPFYSKRRGGTGLGLALVRKITEAHGGTVAADNAERGGGSVAIRLPFTAGRPIDPKSREPEIRTDDSE